MHESSNEKDPLSQRQKGTIRMRSIMDYGMGILWLCMGFFWIFIKYISKDLANSYDDTRMKIFGGMCIVYGAFRCYRGMKKNYLRER